MIAFTYATEPLEIDVAKLNPCELPDDISEPLFTTLVGVTPSNPPWNANVNCLLAIVSAESSVDNE